MSWARAERDSGAERVCLLLSVYPCPRREVRQVPGDAFAGANMAIEEGHGVRYFYEERIHLDRLGPFLFICIPLYLVALHFAPFLRSVHSGAGGSATSA